jgi:hypothetical protein
MHTENSQPYTLIPYFIFKVFKIDIITIDNKKRSSVLIIRLSIKST